MTGNVVKLTALERIVALNILPKEQSYMNMRAIKNSTALLELSDEEAKEYIVPPVAGAAPTGAIQFTKAGAETEKEIDLGEITHYILKAELKRLDEQKKLKPENLSLYEKLVEETKN